MFINNFWGSKCLNYQELVAKKTIKAKKCLGFIQVTQKGSHVILKKVIYSNQENGQDLIKIGCVIPV